MHSSRFKQQGVGRGCCMRRLLTAFRAPVVRSVAVKQKILDLMATKSAVKAQQRKLHYSSHIVVCNVDNSTAAPSVLLFFDNQRYLFNAGEGIQRHFIEYRQRINKINSILATRVSTDTLAGLPGMMLSQVAPNSLEQPAVKSTVYGPPGLSKFCAAFGHYAGQFQLNVVEASSSSRPIIQEPFVTITAVTIQPTAANTAAAAVAAAAATVEEPALKKQRTAAAAAAVLDDLYEATESPPPPAAAAAAAAAASNGQQQQQSGGQRAAALRGSQQLGHAMSAAAPAIVCYICQLASIPGKLDARKAAQLGVPKGPLLGELARGQSVTATNGKTVHPHEVMQTADMPGACLILLDSPSTAYIPAIVNCPQLQQLQEDSQQAAAAAAEGQDPAAAAAAVGIPQKKLIFVHLGPEEVTNSNSYKAWISSFGSGVQHVSVQSNGQINTTVQKAATLQAQLNVIEPQVFSLQGFEDLIQQQQQQQGLAEQQQQQILPDQAGRDQTLDSSLTAAAAAAAVGDVSAAGSDQQQQQQQQQQSAALINAQNGFKFTLAPARYQGASLSDVTAVPDLAAVQAEVRSSRPEVVRLLQDYQAAKAAVQAEATPPQIQGISRSSFELTLLGTCSACPSNYRNVSAYYVDLFDRGGLLVDCGEDTMGQLERRFGREDAARRILQLHAVWISHMHADHHGGLYPLLLHRQYLQQQQQQGSGSRSCNLDPTAAAAGVDTSTSGTITTPQSSSTPLLILGPWPLYKVLSDYSKLLQFEFVFIPNTYFYTPDPRAPPAECLKLYESVKQAAGLTMLQPFPVDHIAHSTGLQLESKDGWKVVFSGDTRPSDHVIKAAHNATLLVHEATFENELQAEAVAKRHSTTAEALAVAAAAGAYRTVLTHFSSRYPKIPVMKPPTAAAATEDPDQQGLQEGPAAAAAVESDLAAVGSVIVGFDLMSINLADLPWIPKMLPVLDELFKEEEQAYQQDDGTAGS